MRSLLIYLSIFFIVFILNVIAGDLYLKKPKISKIIIFISFLILLIFTGCRYYVGTDFESYLELYSNVIALDFNELYLIDIELAPKLLFKLVYMLFDNQNYIFIALSLCTLYPLYKANKLYDYKYLAISILTFCLIFLPFTLNGMRQGVAMSFIILSFAYLFKGKRISAIIAFIIAFLFHKSSILLLPYLLIFNIKKGKEGAFFAIFITLILSVAFLFFNSTMMQFGIISDYEYLISNLDINSMSIKSLFIYLPFLLILILYTTRDELDTYELKGLVISGFILLLLGTTKQYLTRISFYHLMFLMMLMPILIQNIKNKTTRRLILVFYIGYLVFYFIHEFYITGIHEIFPYQTWLT